MERSVNQGILTANWAGFDEPWSRPTYQFSPYTFVQSAIARLAYWLISLPTSTDGYILLARLSSCVWGALAVLLVFFWDGPVSSSGGTLGRSPPCDLFPAGSGSIYARVDLFCVCLSSFPWSWQFGRRNVRGAIPGSSRPLSAWASPSRQNTTPFRFGVDSIHPLPVGANRRRLRGRAVLLVIASLFIAGIGFVVATPSYCGGQVR